MKYDAMEADFYHELKLVTRLPCRTNANQEPQLWLARFPLEAIKAMLPSVKFQSCMLPSGCTVNTATINTPEAHAHGSTCTEGMGKHSVAGLHERDCSPHRTLPGASVGAAPHALSGWAHVALVVKEALYHGRDRRANASPQLSLCGGRASSRAHADAVDAARNGIDTKHREQLRSSLPQMPPVAEIPGASRAAGEDPGDESCPGSARSQASEPAKPASRTSIELDGSCACDASVAAVAADSADNAAMQPPVVFPKVRLRMAYPLAELSHVNEQTSSTPAHFALSAALLEKRRLCRFQRCEEARRQLKVMATQIAANPAAIAAAKRATEKQLRGELGELRRRVLEASATVHKHTRERLAYHFRDVFASFKRSLSEAQAELAKLCRSNDELPQQLAASKKGTESAEARVGEEVACQRSFAGQVRLLKADLRKQTKVTTDFELELAEERKEKSELDDALQNAKRVASENEVEFKKRVAQLEAALSGMDEASREWPRGAKEYCDEECYNLGYGAQKAERLGR
eukprot:5195191-Pleurochrysis_carterae.AAC.2